MAQGKHAPPKAPAARPRRAQARRVRSAAKARRRESARRARRARRGLAVLAVVCVLALAAGFLLQSLLPAPVSAAADERVSTSMVRISEVMTSNASAVRADNGQYHGLGGSGQHRRHRRLPQGLHAAQRRRRPRAAHLSGHHPRPGRIPSYLLRRHAEKRRRLRAARALPPQRLRRDPRPLRRRGRARGRRGCARAGAQSRLPPRPADGAWGVSGDYTPGLPNTLERPPLPGRRSRRQPAGHLRGLLAPTAPTPAAPTASATTT